MSEHLKKKIKNKTQAHLQRVHNNCAKFGECQPKGVGELITQSRYPKKYNK
jgi:hypothetical protein